MTILCPHWAISKLKMYELWFLYTFITWHKQAQIISFLIFVSIFVQAIYAIFCLVSLSLFLYYSITKENLYKSTPYLNDNIYQINGLLILLLHFYLNVTIYRHTNNINTANNNIIFNANYIISIIYLYNSQLLEK